MGTAKEIRNHKHRVEKILKKYSSTRDCDKKLYLAFLEDECGLSNTIGANAFFKLLEFFKQENVPTMDSVGRVRRKFQEQGLYVGQAKAARDAQQEAVKEAIREF
jgi:hypothetical protein